MKLPKAKKKNKYESLEIEDIIFTNKGMRITWSGVWGFGNVDFTGTFKDPIVCKTEYMGEGFAKALMDKFIDNCKLED